MIKNIIEKTLFVLFRNGLPLSNPVADYPAAVSPRHCAQGRFDIR